MYFGQIQRTSVLRHCSGSGVQGEGFGGNSTIDRHNETKGAMNDYLNKSTSANSSATGGKKAWVKNLKSQQQQQQGKKHVQYFAADDPNAKAKASTGNSSSVIDAERNDSYSLSGSDEGDSFGEEEGGARGGGRKSRRPRRGGKDQDDDEEKALDKQRQVQVRDDGDPKRGVSATVSERRLRARGLWGADVPLLTGLSVLLSTPPHPYVTIMNVIR